MTTLFTIGYEQTSPDLLVDALTGAGATALVDIRAVPVSRRRGFSKRDLAGRVEEAGLQYRHLVALGNPKAGRDAGRAGQMAEFQRIYADQLATDAARAALVELAALAEAEAVCLLCYERDASTCHRAIVAGVLAEQHGVQIRHLMPETGAATAGGSPSRPPRRQAAG